MKNSNDVVEDAKSQLAYIAANMVATIEFWCVVYIPAFTSINLSWIQ